MNPTAAPAALAGPATALAGSTVGDCAGDWPPAIARALQSLHNSRQALRHEMVPPPPAHDARAAPGLRLRGWWRRLRRWPAAQLAGEALQHWWQRQPWHPVAETLAQEARRQLWPRMRRHPWASVGLAALAGAGLVALRPWRSRWAEARLRSVPGHAAGWLWRQAGSAPVQAALQAGIASLLVMVTAPRAAPAQTDRPGDTPAPEPMPAHGPTPAPAPDRVREPDTGRQPPVREPRPDQS